MHRFIIFLMGMVIALGIGGCGDGHDIADTSGTDTISVTTDKTELYTGQSCIITAIVKNAGKEVGNREVTFGFVANVTGATLTYTKINTNAAGEAKALYIAGTNAGQDIVRASISNGAMMDVTIVVDVGGYSITVTSDPNSLAAGETSTIAAIVKNAKGTVVSGVNVNFNFMTNKSGATLTPVMDGLTDAAGQATALYIAGGNDSNKIVQDIVSATVGSYSGVEIITRTEGAAAMTITVTADPNSLAAGETSIITAIVKNAKGTPVSEMNVNFNFLTNKSGATLMPLLNGLTDAAGQATAIYIAGGNDPNITVQDIVLATVGGYSGVEIITRTAGAAPPSPAMAVSLSANPSSFTGSWATYTVESILTATVTGSSGSSVSGIIVTFSIESAQAVGEILDRYIAVTNAKGEAVVRYTRPVTAAEAGTKILVVLKATLPNGTYSMITMEIDG